MLANARTAWLSRKVMVKHGAAAPKLLRLPSGNTISNGVLERAKRFRMRSINFDRHCAGASRAPVAPALVEIGSVTTPPVAQPPRKQDSVVDHTSSSHS